MNSTEPAKAHDLFTGGLEDFEKKRFQDAIAKFEQARQLDPSLEGIDRYVGLTLFYLSMIPQAIRALKLAKRSEPQNPNIYLHLAYCYASFGDHVSTEHYLKEGLAIAPTNADLHYNLGCLYLHQDNLGPAEDYLVRSVELDPNCSEAHHNLGYVYNRVGRFTEAAQSFEKSLEITPGDLTTIRKLYRVYGILGQWDKRRELEIITFGQEGGHSLFSFVNPFDSNRQELLKF